MLLQLTCTDGSQAVTFARIAPSLSGYLVGIEHSDYWKVQTSEHLGLEGGVVNQFVTDGLESSGRSADNSAISSASIK